MKQDLVRWWTRAWAMLVVGLCVAVQAFGQTRPLPAVEDLPRMTGHAVRTWQLEDPVLRVGVVDDWRPIDVIDGQGRYTGLSGDLVHALARMLDLRVEVRAFEDFPQLLRAVEQGEVDVLPSMARSSRREAEFLFTDSYVQLPVAYIGRRGETDFSPRHDLGGRRVVVERGYVTHEYLGATFPHAPLLLVDNTVQALRAVAQGQADVYLGSLPAAHHAVEVHGIVGLEVLHDPGLDLGRLHLALPHRARALHGALNEALRRLDPQWLERLAAGWQPRYLQLAPRRTAGIDPALRAEVDRLGELRVGFDSGFGPINAVGEDGQPVGFAIELFRRAAQQAGLRHRLLPQPSFEAGIEAIRARELDVMLSAVRTDRRLAYASFVGPYYSAPSVLVSRLDGGWPSVASLAGRMLAIDRAHYLIPVIEREAPSVRLLQVHTVETAMEQVAQGAADAMITNLEVAAALINRRFLGQLQVSGTVEGRPSELYFMVRKDVPQIAELLRAGLDAVPENDRAALSNTWLRTEFHAGASWTQVLLVVGPLLALLLGGLAMSLLYTRRLQAQVQARRVAERQLQQERDAARAATAAKADFLAEMGHEVRTPLSSIASGLDLLQRETLPGQARILVQAVARSATRLVDLLNNLLDVAKLEAHKIALHPEPVLIGQLARELVEEFGPSARAKGLSIELHGEHAWPDPLMIDPMRMRQVLANLLANAIKFTAQGRVDVVLQPPSAADPRRFVLQVEDTGVGMPETMRAALFERYAQAPGAAQSFGGTGLGLAIVRELVGLMGGEIEAASVSGQGSRFTLRCPATPAGAGDLADARVVHRLASCRVLLVEDAEVNRLLYAEQLRQRGFWVQACDSAEAALQRIAEMDVDLIVTDLQLPGLSGEDLAGRVRAAHPGVAVVALTAGADEREPGRDAAIFDLMLAKPCHPGDSAWVDTLCLHFAPPRRDVQATA